MQISFNSSYNNTNSYGDFGNKDKINQNKNKQDEFHKTNAKEDEKKANDKKAEEKKQEEKKPNELSSEEKAYVQKLSSIDTKVKAHEQAHKAAGGALAGSASYTYEKGPDNKLYAVAGEVPIRSRKGSNPNENIAIARQIQAAALAPADPSPQDFKVAANAISMESDARSELMKQKAEELKEKTEGEKKEKKELDEKKEKEEIKPYKKLNTKPMTLKDLLQNVMVNGGRLG